MDRIMSTAQPEDCHRAVLVRKPNPAIATNTFKFYLSNKKRSGGSKVSNIIRDEENNCLIVFYDSRDVAEQVAERQHTLDGYKLHIELLDRNKDTFCESHSEAGFTQSEGTQSVPGKGEASFSNASSRPAAATTFDTGGSQGQGSCLYPVLPSPPDEVASDKQTEETSSFSYRGRAKLQSGGTSSASLLEKPCSNDSSPQPRSTVTFDTDHTGSHHDAVEQGNQLHPEMLSQHGEAVSNISSQNVHGKKPTQIQKILRGFRSAYFNILDTFCEEIAELLGISMDMFEHDGVKITGEKHDVEQAEKHLQYLLCKQNVSGYIEEMAAKFSGWDEIFSKLDSEKTREERRFSVMLQEHSFGEEELCICLLGDGHSQPVCFDEFLKTLVGLKRVKVQQDAEILLFTYWEDFKDNEFEEKFGKEVEVTVSMNESPKLIWVAGSVIHLDEAVRSIENFLQNVSDKEHIELKPKQKEFMQTFILGFEQSRANRDNTAIYIEGNHLTVEGRRARVRRETNRLRGICRDLKCKRVIYTHPDLSTILHSDLWEELKKRVSAEKECLITELPDPQIPNADEDQGDWGQWHATVLHSYQCQEGPTIHVVDGEGEELQVDAAVVCQGETRPKQSGSLQQFSFEPSSGARPKELQLSREHKALPQQAGRISIVNAGGRPCKAVIEISIPHYFNGEGHLYESLQKLMADILQLCRDHHLTSLALPVIGVDVKVPGNPLPIDVVTKAIVQCVQSIRSNTDESNKMAHVCLCSCRAACLRGLLHAQRSDPLNTDFRFLSSAVADSGGPVLDVGAINIVPGDIAKVQADVLVVPLDIDIDLDLHKSKVTKSLLVRGGSGVQYSLEKGNAWLFPRQNIEERNEELADRHVLMGDAGSLSARHILYVHIPPWGPGVKQMMKDRVIKCLQKASEKGCKTMAMTALGVGKLKYPPHFVARTTLAIVSDFMEQRKTSLKCVHFVIYPGDQGTLTAFSEEYWKWKRHRVYRGSMDLPPLKYPHPPSEESPGSSSYAAVAGRGDIRGRGRGRERGRRDRNHNAHHGNYGPQVGRSDLLHSGCSVAVRLGSIRLSVKLGNLTYERCGIVVNTVNEDFDFSGGGVSKAFEEMCGRTLVHICRRKETMKQYRKKGFVVTAAPGLPNCDHILHLNFEKFKARPRETLKQCLSHVQERNSRFRSVAFPALGTGGSHAFTPEQLLDHLISVVKDIKKPKQLEDVRLVVSHDALYQCLARHLMMQHSNETSQHNSGQATHASPKQTKQRDVAPLHLEAYMKSSHAQGRKCSEDTVSLFFFSDSEDKRSEASLEMKACIEEILPVDTPTVKQNEERNTSEGFSWYPFGSLI